MPQRPNKPNPRLLRPDPNAGADWWENFQRLLDEQNDWPAPYLFKFIAPQAQLEDLKAVFGQHPVTVRASSKGNYASVTAEMTIHHSEEIRAIYETVGKMEGVIAL